MFKKLTAFFLLTAFTHVYAVTPVVQAESLKNELNRTFDSLNYKLNVEWDQKDSTVFDQAITGFEDEIALLQEQGVTNKDLIDHAMEKIKDKQIQSDMLEMQKVIAENQMTDTEARQFVIQKLSSTYSHGASWSGSRMGVHTAFIIGAIILIVVACNKHHNQPKDTHEQDPCPRVPGFSPSPCYPEYPTYGFGPSQCCQVI